MHDLVPLLFIHGYWPPVKTPAWLKAIALWQFTGGALGGVIFLDSMRRLQVADAVKWKMLGIFVPLCVVSVVAGLALLEGRKRARTPSIVIQSLQLVGVGTSHLTYRLVLGPYLSLYITGSTLGLNAGFQPELRWHTSGPMPYEPHVVINLLALTCLGLLIRWHP